MRPTLIVPDWRSASPSVALIGNTLADAAVNPLFAGRVLPVKITGASYEIQSRTVILPNGDIHELWCDTYWGNANF